MKFNHFAVITTEMKSAIAFFRDIMELPVSGDEGYAEVDAGGFVFSLMPNALVPLTGQPQGIILQFELEDVASRAERIQQRGGKLLYGPRVTDWGTESVFVAGPAGLVIELYRWRQDQTH
ncbi:VOC family protein [Ktedonosporobacter rubrisoli]|uniref:VOC family protein n=1 Tax=Ktedonosporobacter rubrisoli TaxID=2509675 RepID=A0A4V0YY78_KTERU|nr:VOC family protein [Ktedonosporobacter rubrisoli]QBD75271.1 VOC family protein [Ktedonosporobacter rubrisoli]